MERKSYHPSLPLAWHLCFQFIPSVPSQVWFILKRSYTESSRRIVSFPCVPICCKDLQVPILGSMVDYVLTSVSFWQELMSPHKDTFGQPTPIYTVRSSSNSPSSAEFPVPLRSISLGKFLTSLLGQ